MITALHRLTSLYPPVSPVMHYAGYCCPTLDLSGDRPQAIEIVYNCYCAP